MANKNDVFKTYDKIADWFDEHRSRELFEKPYLDKFISLLKPGAHILDVGCGMGEPITQYLISRGLQVTGVEGSQKLIALARERLPEGRFIHADMRILALGETFDGIIVWHSLFHLSQDCQKSMFRVFAEHLRPQGILMFTSGHQEDEIWSENGGEKLYHASLSVQSYRELLSKHQFEIISHTAQDQDCGEATVWLAQLNNHSEKK